ncbi:MAG: DUF362 domain-containing protein, partial [Candidatus Fermentibacter sp.]|nr:DUF362 domain-containing protein [Candidatus Fermentibacter sp.]
MTGLACALSMGMPETEWYSREALARLVREAAAGASGGQPLRMAPGSRVLIKPNWVYHRNASGGGVDCMATHPEFVLAALGLVLESDPSSVVIGDAPVQGCIWDSLVTPELRDRIAGAARGRRVDVIDFRRTIMRGAGLDAGHDRDVRPEDRFVLFDLGCDSLLEPVSSPPGRFRVTMYDPGLISRRHFPGRHQYLISKEALESDVILSLPKLKTHRKAGITGALKNLVGLNGNKEFLPHHRKGGARDGGDCYPGRSVLKSIAENLLDASNRRIGRRSFPAMLAGVRIALELQRLLHGEAEIDGGWSGNDTVWRTVLDIDRIALYGRIDGTMADVPQRRVVSLTDALVCGQGDGPMMPDPLPLGFVTCSDSPVDADILHCRLLGFDPGLIPMVREASSGFRWPLPSGEGIPEIPGASGGVAPIEAVPPRAVSYTHLRA